MYLEIDEGFPKHRKTLRLRSIMKDPRAGWYMVDLWTWACRSCPDGDLSGISSYEIEEAANYQQCDGKLCKAMIDSGFIDTDADGNPTGLHNWMKRTGAAIARMAKRASDMKALRDQRKKERDGTVTAQLQHGDTHVGDQTRPDQTSPDQTSMCDPARARSNPLANEPGKPSVDHVLTMFSAIRAKTCATKALFYQASETAKAKCAALLAGIDRDAVADIEPVIQLACEHVRDGAEDWTDSRNKDPNFLWGTIAARWTALREELHGCAPKVAKAQAKGKPAPTMTPIREW